MIGVVENVRADAFPRQGSWLGKTVGVCFNYDTSQLLAGVVIRDDAEAPWQTILRLDDGRVVLSTECQFSLSTLPSRAERLARWLRWKQ